MSDNMDWIKKRLMGSSTMPSGTGRGNGEGGPLNVLQTGHVHHHHADDGSCCGGHHHDHAHAHSHDHHHVHGSGCCVHEDDEEDVTSPKGGCC